MCSIWSNVSKDEFDLSFGKYQILFHSYIHVFVINKYCRFSYIYSTLYIYCLYKGEDIIGCNTCI